MHVPEPKTLKKTSSQHEFDASIHENASNLRVLGTFFCNPFRWDTTCRMKSRRVYKRQMTFTET